jgi:hypothetical protein
MLKNPILELFVNKEVPKAAKFDQKRSKSKCITKLETFKFRVSDAVQIKNGFKSQKAARKLATNVFAAARVT